MSQNTEKKMTSYDRKVMAREAAAKKAKNKGILTTVATIAILVCLVALIVIVPITKKQKQAAPYFYINNESVSQLEFIFHKTNLINSNMSLLSYLGVTSLADLNTMVYNEETGATWNDFFEERTVTSIKENKALIADAKAKNISLDVDAEYKTYMEGITASADAAGMNVDTYLTSMYGADERTLKKIIDDNLTALLYSEYLATEMAATDDEAQAEYDANKGDYDSVDYRVLEFPTLLMEGASEEDTNAAKAASKAQAQEMLDKVNAGEDFETLCATYALEDERTDYADTTTDKSLVTGATYLASYQPYSDWLFEDTRKEGETYLFTTEDGLTHYAIQYVKRYMGDGVLDSIKQNLTYTAVTEYIAELSKDYTISDPDDNLPAF